jgi:hypothetical protein
MPTPAQSIYIHVGETYTLTFTHADTFAGYTGEFKVGRKTGDCALEEVESFALTMSGATATTDILPVAETLPCGRYVTQLVLTNVESGDLEIVDGPLLTILTSL